ncbi:MAG: KAP family NTPase [Blautia sp.]|nr:KAP family NTPase [Blautia sp.]MCM1219880.1 KAP family NTPase [Lachnospiraceae bacterium]
MIQGIDLLNRNEFVDKVLQVVNQLSDNRKGSCFSIEGSWGIGKTFVLNELWKKLEEEGEKYFLFNYNCWQHDYYEEPAVAIISAMKASIREDGTIINAALEDTVDAGYQFVWGKLKEIAGVYLENKIGVNLLNWMEDIKNIKESNDVAEQVFDEMFGFNRAMGQVRGKMEEIAKKRTIVLIVDELDRCIPQYAIKVLERLHHLFYGLDNVVVIMAIDRSQLEHSVEEMFGKRWTENEHDSMGIEKYLKKFIDFSMVLDYGTVNDRYQEKYAFYFEKFRMEENDERLLAHFLPPLFEGIDIRRIEKIIEKANVVHSVICKEEVNISVLAFEMLYEVLRFYKVVNMECVVFAHEKAYSDFETLGEKRAELFQWLRDESRSGRYGEPNAVNDDLCGRILFYFVRIFCPRVIQGERLYDFLNCDIRYAKELDIARKYCEFREIIE